MAASTGAIGSEGEDHTYAIAAILMFGAVMVVLFPLLGRWLQLGDQFFGLCSDLP